jgi:hypothetical protein
MRLKITPLFLASIGVIIYGFYYIFYKWDSNIGPIAGILVIVLGFICLSLWFILRTIFHSRFWLHLLCEVVLIVVVAFAGYKLTRKVLLHIPGGFKGDILLIYGVEKVPRLRPGNIFYRNVDVWIPPSGIVLTSNRFAEKYINNLIVMDSLHRQIFEPGKYVGYGLDTLNCGNKKYLMEVINFHYPPDSLKAQDDERQRNLKKQEGCKLIMQ